MLNHRKNLHQSSAQFHYLFVILKDLPSFHASFLASDAPRGSRARFACTSTCLISTSKGLLFCHSLSQTFFGMSRNARSERESIAWLLKERRRCSYCGQFCQDLCFTYFFTPFCQQLDFVFVEWGDLQFPASRWNRRRAERVMACLQFSCVLVELCNPHAVTRQTQGSHSHILACVGSSEAYRTCRVRMFSWGYRLQWNRFNKFGKRKLNERRVLSRG